MSKRIAIAMGVLLIVVVLAPALVFGAALRNRETYYVSKTGSNANTGISPASPLRTFAAAVARMRPGDRCLVMAGIYHQTLRINRSGLPGDPIVFEPYHKARVVIDAADRITQWTQYSTGIYRAPMPWNMGVGMNQVFLDGRMILEARYPEQETTDPFDRGLARITVPRKHTKVWSPMSTLPLLTSPQLANHPINYFKGAVIVAQVGVAWSTQSAMVLNSGQHGRLKLGAISNPWCAGAGWGYATGLLRLLKVPNQWIFKAGTLYIDQSKNAIPTRSRIEAKRRKWCLDFIDHCSWVKVRGFHLFGGSIQMFGNHCTVSRCSGLYMGQFSYIAWNGYYGAGGSGAGACAVNLSGDHDVIRRCHLAWSAGSGIVLHGQDNLITHNTIHDMDYAGTYASSIDMTQGGGNRITFNTIYNAGRDIIQLHSPDADKIEYNNLYRSGLLCKDLGVIYVYGTNGRDTRIAHNWIHDNVARGPNHPGVYLDNGCTNFTVDHNVIWNCGRDAGVRINGPCSGLLIVNNTLFNCLPVGAKMYISPSCNPHWPHGVHYQAVNNLYLGSHAGRELVDPAHDDFRLKTGSTAIGAGKVVPGLAVGIAGRPPDLGAYQGGESYWIPGADGHR